MRSVRILVIISFMIICVCSNINERAIVDAVRRGCVTLASIQDELGAGRQCGRCILALEETITAARDRSPPVPIATMPPPIAV